MRPLAGDRRTDPPGIHRARPRRRPHRFFRAYAWSRPGTCSRLAGAKTGRPHTGSCSRTGPVAV